MRLRSKASLLVLPLASALVLAGCGGGGSESGSGDNAITIRGGDPQNPLLPTNTQETEGGMVVDALWSGLVKYNNKNGKAENEMAESITPSQQNKVFDIKIKKGWKFHNGEEVTADNFIKAWNFGAYAPNGQINAPFFEDIQGYDQVSPEEGKPTAKTMSGLKQISPYEFKVTLKQPNINWQQKIGYTAFYPMPDSFFKAKDKDEWAKKPVGNGPFKFVSYTPKTETKITRFDGFKGPDKPKVKDITFKIYTQGLDAAYQDLLSGNLDFMEAVPPSALAGGKYKKDLDGRVKNKQTSSSTAIAVPEYLNPAWKNPKLRKAVSMAINRKQITKQVFNGSREPMDGWVPSSVEGASPNACGEFCKFNPQKARQMMAQTGYKGTIPIQSNSDGGHKEWIEAVSNSINKTFKGMGVKAQFSPVPTFDVLRQRETDYKMNGFWRSGWNLDYAAPDNILAALYETGGSSNTTKYSNPAFDKALQAGLQAPTQQAANQKFGQAEKMLAKRMPAIPLWTETGTAGYSSDIKSVKFSYLKRLADLTTIVPASSS